jgi:hypothetical protein
MCRQTGRLGDHAGSRIAVFAVVALALCAGLAIAANTSSPRQGTLKGHIKPPFVIDSSKFEDAFGRSRPPHREAVERTVEWFRSRYPPVEYGSTVCPREGGQTRSEREDRQPRPRPSLEPALDRNQRQRLGAQPPRCWSSINSHSRRGSAAWQRQAPSLRRLPWVLASQPRFPARRGGGE